jgi:hypothetical protein
MIRRTGDRRPQWSFFLLIACSPALFFASRKMEAEGIEPSSRDNSNGGLYMLSRCFVRRVSPSRLNRRGEHRHPSRQSSRLYLAIGSTAESESYPVFCGRRVTGYAACRGYLIIRQPYEPERQNRPGLQHQSWQLRICSVFNEANERPRHATTTVAIRSKPIAPGSL